MRLRAATLTASIAHLAAIGAVSFVPARAPVQPAAVAPIDVSFDDEPAPSEPSAAQLPSPSPEAPAPETPSAAPAKLAALGGRGVDAIGAAGARAAPNGAPGDGAPGDGAPAPVDAPGGAWTFDVAPKTFDATARGLVRATAPDAPAKPRATGSTTGGVAEALDERDRALGVSRGGEVLSAMEGVARHGDAPIRGNATFEVVVDARGQIAVTLASASEGFDAWARQIPAMRDAVGRRHVRLPPGASGLRIVVRLESRVQYADGRDPRADGVHTEATGLKITETKTQIVIEKLPRVAVGVVGKVCGAGIRVGLEGVTIAGGCSPENIGSPMTRVVSGRVVSEARL